MTRTCDTSVILGPPGTGKTSRLIEVAREAAVRGGKTLFVSHTRAAAHELAKRCGIPKAEALTLHAMCYRVLDMSRSQVVDDIKLSHFGELTGFDFNRTGRDDSPSEVLQLIQLADCTGLAPEEVYANSTRPCSYDDFSYFLESYRSWKQFYMYRDFNDMLWDVASGGPLPYDNVFIDEAQDLSKLQWRVVEVLMRGAQVAAVAGDDDQAIFEWGGAWPGGISWFINHYSPRVELLTQSHRVPLAVHPLAMRIVRRISARVEKDYNPRDAVGSLDIIGSLDSIESDDFKGSTVLYRDVAAREDLDGMLIERRLSYRSRSPDASPYDSRYGRAWRSLDAWWRGQTITDKAAAQLTKVLQPWAIAEFESGGAEALKGFRPSELLTVNGAWASYMDDIDLAAPPDVTISTIHGFKGAESDKVFLMLGMSERVGQQYAINPDAEHRVFYVGVTRAKQSLILVGGENEYPV